MITKDNEPINLMADGGYIVQHGTYRYVVRDTDEAGVYKKAEIEAYLAEHPEALVPEPVPPEPTAEQKAAAIRARRNALLAACDWTSLVDCQLAEADYNRWRIYRQALRDITEQASFPDSVEWPTAPKR